MKESGRFLAATEDEAANTEALLKTSHAIINSAAALMMNLELLAGAEQADVVADARASIDRIVELAHSLRPLAKCSPPRIGRTNAVRKVAG